MGWMLVFFGLGCVGLAVIAAAFWDYRSREERRKSQETFHRATSTTMTSGNTGYVIITYERGER
jgi:predicted MFS family arabinose efflux permease